MWMVLPELWSKSSDTCLKETICHLEKYKHLIKWNDDETIMEFGFADGKNSCQSLGPILPKSYKEFVAADISKIMIDYSKEHRKIPRSRFVQMDIAASNIPKEFQGYFDHIFGFHVIHWVKNPRQAFANINNMLKPGGQAFLTFFERMPQDDMFENLSKHPKWGKYEQKEMMSPYYYSENPEEEYKKDLDAVGFENYIFKSEKGFFQFSSIEECDNILLSVNPSVPKIPKDEVEEYLKQYYAEKHNSSAFEYTNENGETKISVRFKFFVVIATKSK